MKLSALCLLFLPYTLAWWKHMTLYEIYVRSFKDSDGDGIGDLNGIIQKLDHLVDLGIDAVHLTPFFKSPMMDMGYDISNYTAIDPLFGTMRDFERLMNAVKKRDIKLIGDLVINHSSDEHPWFKKSIDKIEPYTDFYVWANPKNYDVNGKPIPPNNWIAFPGFGRSVWEWNDERKQFYLHQFSKKQPDFNLRNEQLKREIEKIIEFWFNKGISGFRLDAPWTYVEDKLLRDEPINNPNKKGVLEYWDLNHIYTLDTPDTYAFIHEIRNFVDNYSRKHGMERILIAEVYSDLNYTMAYYGTQEYKITHFPFNTGFATTFEVETAKIYDKKINRWLQNMPNGAIPNWMAENHDIPRIDRKLGVEYMDIIVITIMTLPGIACIYYGQEIGMRSATVRSDQKTSFDIVLPNRVVHRDDVRTPMQWDNSLNAGFSSNLKTWLPVHPNYWKVNVKTEKTTTQSRYNMFKILANLRKHRTMKHGNFKSYVLSTWVYSYIRSYKKRMYVMILNLGTETEMFHLHDAIPQLPLALKVVTASQNAGYYAGDCILSTSKFPYVFIIRPSSAVVFTNGSVKNHNFNAD